MYLNRIVVFCSFLAIGIASPLTHADPATDLLDAEQAFQAAKIAASNGDFQAAIVSLERILLIKPNLANIQFELGLLYGRVGANARSSYYLNKSLESESMPLDIRARAKLELAKLQSSLARTVVGGFAGLRLQSDSNPAAATDFASFFDVGSGTVVPGRSLETAEGDVSTHLSAGLNVASPFGAEQSISWVSGITVNAARYQETDSANYEDLSLRTGIEYPINPQTGSDLPATLLNPFAIYTVAFESGEQELTSAGAGISLRVPGKKLLRTATLQAASTSYEDALEAGEKDGTNLSLRAGVQFPWSERSRISLRANVGRNDAEADYESFRIVGAEASFSRSVRLGQMKRNGVVALGVGVAKKTYEGAEAQVNPFVTRDDTIPTASLRMSIPVTRTFSFNAIARYSDNDSNLPNYTYDNFRVSAGINWLY